MRYNIKFSLALVATILFAPLSFAQDNSDLDDEEIEEVVVTGSKLGRSNFEADVPILTISSEEITNRLTNTAGNAVARLPNAASKLYPRRLSSWEWGRTKHCKFVWTRF